MATIVVEIEDSTRTFVGKPVSRTEANDDEKGSSQRRVRAIGKGYIGVDIRAGRMAMSKGICVLVISIEREGLQGSAIHIGRQPACTHSR